MSKEIEETNTEEELVEAFKAFGIDDAEHQKISKVQIKETMRKYGERLPDDQIDKLFKEIDYDKDGGIGFADFVRMMMSK